MTLALTLSFALLLLLLCCALLWSSWPRWLKGLLIVGVTAMYFVGFESVKFIWGIPSTEPLPEKFLFIAAVVEEPTTKAAGAIYLWVSALREGKPAIEPRAYKLPYTKGSHSQVSEGLRRSRDGSAQMGTIEKKNTEGTGGFAGLKPGDDERELKIRDLPTPQLPEK